MLNLKGGINFLGFRVFYYHKLLKKSNILKNKRKQVILKELFQRSVITFDAVHAKFEGWLAYAKQGNTYNLRRKIIKEFEGSWSMARAN